MSTMISISYSKEDLDNMALCVWKEARGEGELGMKAVADVIVNRARAWYPIHDNPIHATVYAHNQFTSMSVPSDPEYNLQPKEGDVQYAFCQSICEPIILGQMSDITNGALYYANVKTMTSGWFVNVISGSDGKGTENHPLKAVIGKQSFYA